jgi:hypothetical protein
MVLLTDLNGVLPGLQFMSRGWFEVVLCGAVGSGLATYFVTTRVFCLLGLSSTKGGPKLKVVKDVSVGAQIAVWAAIVAVISGIAIMLVLQSRR